MFSLLLLLLFRIFFSLFFLSFFFFLRFFFFFFVRSRPRDRSEQCVDSRDSQPPNNTLAVTRLSPSPSCPHRAAWLQPNYNANRVTQNEVGGGGGGQKKKKSNIYCMTHVFTRHQPTWDDLFGRLRKDAEISSSAVSPWPHAPALKPLLPPR